VLVAAWLARRNLRLRPLLFTCLSMALFLCLPARKWGNHTYVTFPLLGALAGCGTAPLLQRLQPRAIAAGSIVLAALACVFLASGLGRRVMRPPCVFSTALAPALDALPRGSPILVATPLPDDAAVAELAAERGLEPFPVRALPLDGSISAAVATQGVQPAGAWRQVASGGGWQLLQR
jgi:hypothetical protein